MRQSMMPPPSAYERATYQWNEATHDQERFTASENTYHLDATNNITSEWWEKAGQRILETSHDFEEIQFICKPFLFKDTDALCVILARRSRGWLNAFLSLLRGSKVGLHSDSLNTAKEIIGLLHQTDSQPLPVRDWSWIPHAIASEKAPAAIAETISLQMSTDFGKIPFYSLVRYTLGYEEPLVITFLDGLSNSANDLARQLRQLRELGLPIDKWISLSKAMDFQHPLARWLVSACLPCEMLLDIRQALYFLSEPIERFFVTPDRNLVRKLKPLAYLAERHKYISIHPLDADWRSNFSIDYSFMYDMSEPNCVAKSDTKYVAEAFRHLSVADFQDQSSKRRKGLARRWLTLSVNVATLVAAFPESVGSVMELAKALLKLKNYQSVTAVGYGLQEVRSSWSAELWPIWNAINPENNFAACLIISNELPGFQWLNHTTTSLIRSNNALEVMHNAFRFVQCLEQEEKPRDATQVDKKETGGKEILATDACTIVEYLPSQIFIPRVNHSFSTLKRKMTSTCDGNIDELDRKRAKTSDDCYSNCGFLQSRAAKTSGWKISPITLESYKHNLALLEEANKERFKKRVTSSTGHRVPASKDCINPPDIGCVVGQERNSWTVDNNITSVPAPSMRIKAKKSELPSIQALLPEFSDLFRSACYQEQKYQFDLITAGPGTSTFAPACPQSLQSERSRSGSSKSIRSPQAGSNLPLVGNLVNHATKKKHEELTSKNRVALENWFNVHLAYPYPSKDERQRLRSETGLSPRQISNWFNRARASLGKVKA